MGSTSIDVVDERAGYWHTEVVPEQTGNAARVEEPQMKVLSDALLFLRSGRVLRHVESQLSEVPAEHPLRLLTVETV